MQVVVGTLFATAMIVPATRSTQMSVTESLPATRVVDGAEVPTPGTYAIDASHTHAGFVVRHLMVSKVRGAFSGVSGTVTVADDVTESSVEVEIDPATIDTRD